MRLKLSTACALLAAFLLLPPTAQGQALTAAQKSVTELETLLKQDDQDREIGALRLALKRLENSIGELETDAKATSATQQDKEWYSRAQAARSLAEELLDGGIADLIKGTKPMTAVLFSTQDRNEFEVLTDPASSDQTVGIINQSSSGSTGGIMIAAEAPFAFPRTIGWGEPVKDRVFPIGAWFGVNLQAGGGEEVSDVGLAAGLSFSLISANTLARLKSGESAGLTGSARLLVGVVFGEVVSLGTKSAEGPLQVGDPYPIGVELPLSKDKEISLAVGIGFRF